MSGAHPCHSFALAFTHALRVVKEMRLADGTLWPIPITLDVNAETAAKYPVGSKVALIDHEVRSARTNTRTRAHTLSSPEFLLLLATVTDTALSILLLSRSQTSAELFSFADQPDRGAHGRERVPARQGRRGAARLRLRRRRVPPVHLLPFPSRCVARGHTYPIWTRSR